MNQKNDNQEKDKILPTLDLKSAFNEIHDYRINGIPKGLSTGWSSLDLHLQIIPGQLIVVSGFPSMGKSEVVENILCFMVRTYKWKGLLYSPEAYPPSNQVRSLMEKIVGKPMYGDHKMDPKEQAAAEFLIKKNIEILSADGDPFTLREIINHIRNQAKKGINYDIVVLDPWNEIELLRPYGVSESDFIGKCLMYIRRLARKHGISFWIVAHPSKPLKKNAQGEYDPPDLYDISGTAHWRNKADNGLICHRYSLTTKRAVIMVKKIKNKLYGKPGSVPLDFDFGSGRFNVVQEEGV